MTHEPVVVLDQLSCRFGAVQAVDRISLRIGRGEFFSLLGPSGCGKTTTLRLIAGFETPETGDIQLLGVTANQQRPWQRPIGMVFQHAALFPHLTVADNVAFGLVERRIPRAEIAARVGNALELVRLDPAIYATRRPAALSGGQRQRVALARALVLEPPVLLLDEPLAALDLQLRKAMQLELRELNQRLGITFVLVTHDQEEALVMSDRIAVMSDGRVEQVGTPEEIYRAPRTAFVAGFIGEANILTGTVTDVRDGGVTVVGRGGARWEVAAAAATGTVLQIALRPEWLTLAADPGGGDGANIVEGSVEQVIFRGETLHVLVRTGEATPWRVAIPNDAASTAGRWRHGTTVWVRWAIGAAQVLAG